MAKRQTSMFCVNNSLKNYPCLFSQYTQGPYETMWAVPWKPNFSAILMQYTRRGRKCIISHTMPCISSLFATKVQTIFLKIHQQHKTLVHVKSPRCHTVQHYLIHSTNFTNIQCLILALVRLVLNTGCL